MPFARRAACAVVAVCSCFGPGAAAKSIERSPVHASVAPSRAHESKGPRDEPASGKSDGKKESARSKKKHAPQRPLRKVRALPANATWRAFRRPPWQRGYVTLVGHGKKWSGYLVDKYGDVVPGAREGVSTALASWRTGKHIEIDARLLGLIADVSDEFGGRPIRIVSGYRERSYAPDSRHKSGEAFDFSVPEVPNEAVRDFLRSLPDTGVGYYPNSTHVHLDVREKPTYWVDYSRPGDRPEYAWNRRVAGLTPTERLLVHALDGIVAKARSIETVGASTEKPRVTAPNVDRARSHAGGAPVSASAAHVTAAADNDAAEDEREEDTTARTATAADAGHTPGFDAGLPKAPAASAVTDAELPPMH